VHVPVDRPVPVKVHVPQPYPVVKHVPYEVKVGFSIFRFSVRPVRLFPLPIILFSRSQVPQPYPVPVEKHVPVPVKVNWVARKTQLPDKVSENEKRTSRSELFKKIVHGESFRAAPLQPVFSSDNGWFNTWLVHDERRNLIDGY